uniref:Uncharacterized protein n=1 Tax=Knipowitschia caucasica TaxID=637954 RepID=A0AAV2LY90_KNICA
MSDLDDAGARFAMKFQKSNLNTDLLEEDEPADSPWECPPDELYPSKHFSGGLESVLSGSEEDIHLQSVNMFIEQMKSSSEGVKSAKQGQKADNTDCFTLSDLGSCIQTEEKKLDQACKDVQSTIPEFDTDTLFYTEEVTSELSIQTAVANPNLDAPLLPLKQSDMCLICIAFASWVLKTANPQVGDAWKAVLLANVSALSAIWYLRKYVKVETSAGEKKPNLKTLSPS